MPLVELDTQQLLEDIESSIMRGNTYKAKILITELRLIADRLVAQAEDLKRQADKAEKYLK